MSIVILVIAIGLGAGWMVWRRRGRGRTPAPSGTPAGITLERLAEVDRRQQAATATPPAAAS